MALEEYRRKRRFDRTPEPPGRVARPGGRRFVVQMHRARRLHYDFRLELDGVLKSWAVPKRPSLDPRAKHLAVLVEDHPLDYQDFEGVIPAGNYGAGTVIVWDRGTYHAAGARSAEEDESRLREGLAKGHLSVVLEGKKLKGEFALVRMKSAEEESAWLLIKANDAFADGDLPETEDISVLSGRTLEEMQREAPAEGRYWAERSRLDLRDRGLPASAFPHGISPMLPITADGPFDGEGWLFEIKWDGYRAIAEVERGDVRLISRRNLSLNARFPPLVEALRSLARDAVLDGEIAVLDEEGRSHFQLLQDYQEGRANRLVYYLFDLLYLDQYDLRELPLRDRKELLQQVLPAVPNLRYSDHVWRRGKTLFEVARQHGVEGIMAKDGGSPYLSGRTGYWQKIKIVRRQEAVIAGFTAPRGGRTGFGALVLGVYENGELVYIGHTGTGFDEATLSRLHRLLLPLATPHSPFRQPPPTNALVTWVRPELVCEVSFAEWTNDGVMRFPVFLGLREDKPPEDVSREDGRG